MKNGKQTKKQLDFRDVRINKIYNLEQLMKQENNTIEKIISCTSQILDKYKKQYTETGEQFNIFSLLRAETKEVQTHSRFIGELLNPNGKHAQGTIFLNLFLEIVGNKVFTSESSKIFIEKYIGKKKETSGGRLDLLLIDQHKNFICIENKIYALEQENQLTRYQEYAKKYKNPVVYYLTLFGSESYSTSDKENVINISYNSHIVKWLEKCILMMDNKPYLREGISQYLQLIKKLTNQTELNMTQEMEKIVLADQNNLNAFLKLHSSFFNVKSKMIHQIALKIKQFLESNSHDKIAIQGFKTITQTTHPKYRGLLFAFTIQVENQDTKMFRLTFKEKAFRKLVLVPTTYDENKQKFTDDDNLPIALMPMQWTVNDIQEIYFDKQFEHIFWLRLNDAIEKSIELYINN